MTFSEGQDGVSPLLSLFTTDCITDLEFLGPPCNRNPQQAKPKAQTRAYDEHDYN